MEQLFTKNTDWGILYKEDCIPVVPLPKKEEVLPKQIAGLGDW